MFFVDLQNFKKNLTQYSDISRIFQVQRKICYLQFYFENHVSFIRASQQQQYLFSADLQADKTTVKNTHRTSNTLAFVVFQSVCPSVRIML